MGRFPVLRAWASWPTRQALPPPRPYTSINSISIDVFQSSFFESLLLNPNIESFEKKRHLPPAASPTQVQGQAHKLKHVPLMTHERVAFQIFISLCLLKVLKTWH